jgi:hypothetical protein
MLFTVTCFFELSYLRRPSNTLRLNDDERGEAFSLSRQYPAAVITIGEGSTGE